MLMPIGNRYLLLTAWSLVTLLVLSSPQPSGADSQESLAQSARAILSSRCYRCHGMNGVASKNVFVLDRARLISAKTIVPGDAKSLLLRMVETGAMPLGGPELSNEDKATLQKWILSGASDWEATSQPSPRAFLSESAIHLLILQDLERARERARPFLRYFSIAHLYNAGLTDEELEGYRVGLAKLLNSILWH